MNFHPKIESKVISSREGLVANKFAKKIELGKFDKSLLKSDEDIEQALIQSKVLIEGSSIPEVIAILRTSGILENEELVIEDKKPEKKEPEFIPIEKKRLSVVHDEKLEENLKTFFEHLEHEKENILNDETELTAIYEKTQITQKKESKENNAYYYEFAEKGLIKGGVEEVDADLASLALRKAEFAEKTQQSETSHDLEKMKKVATITERALVHGVSNLDWFGKDISVEPVSEFDDVKRGVDDMLEIRKEDDESSFMGLGIDVTFRGLYSEQYKKKFFTLLHSIRSGYKTKVKYFKNHKGELMKEFAVPKMILYFDVADVKNLVRMMKHVDDESMKEKFQNSPQKFSVMNQIIVQCQKLSAFAADSENSIFRKYTEVVDSIKELGWKNEDIKNMLAVQHDDNASRQIDSLIKEFLETEQNLKTQKQDEILDIKFSDNEEE